MSTLQIGDLEYRAPVVTQFVYDLLNDNQEELGLKGVYYGYQQLIPEFPAISVESGRKTRAFSGTHRFDLNFTVNLSLEHGLLQSTEVTKKQCEEMAQLVEDKLHEDFYLGGLVIFGFVTSIDSGVRTRDSDMIRTSRIVWEGASKEGF